MTIGNDPQLIADHDDDSVSYETDTDLHTTTERDEKKEVYKMSAKDTFRVRLWRAAMTVVLLLTALGVTLTTYKLLKDEERNNFEVAVRNIGFRVVVPSNPSHSPCYFDTV